MPSHNARTDGHQNLHGWLVITSRIFTAVLNFITIRIRLRNFASHICEIAYRVFTGLVFLVLTTDNTLPPRPLRRFWRSVHQNTSFRARMCLLGVQKTKFYILIFRSVFDGTFGSKRALTWGLDCISKHP